MDYATLAAKIEDHIDRNDLDSQIQQAILDTVRLIQNEVSLPDMYRYQDFTWTGGESSLNANANIKDITGIFYSASAFGTSESPTELRRVSLQEAIDLYPTSSTGTPDVWYYDELTEQYPDGSTARAYTVIGIRPTNPASTNAYIRVYSNNYITSFASTAEPWLLRNHWNLVFYGALVELCPLIRDFESIPFYQQKFLEASHALKRHLLASSQSGYDQSVEPAYG